MKNIVIVGATSAIAIEFARLSVKSGANFYLVGRSAEKLALISSDLLARGAGFVEIFVMDSSDYTKYGEMLDSCLIKFKQIDLVLIAHGTLPDQVMCQQSAEMTINEFNNNATSVIGIMTIFASQLEVQRYGTLAVISSVAGDRGRPSNYVYGAAKAAVSVFSEGMRARLFKCGVHVIDIKPGFVATPMTKDLDLPKILTSSPEKIASLIIDGIKNKKSVIYVPGYWRLIMFIIKTIPAAIFKRLSL